MDGLERVLLITKSDGERQILICGFFKKKKKKLITIRKKETHRFENKLVLTGGERKEEEQDTGKGLRDANYYV